MAAIARPLAEHYVDCAIPGAGLKIQLSLDVIDRLNAAVMEGYKLVPRRGLEVGGLLLGRMEPGSVIVEEFQAIASEHQRGPSWLLSDKDRQALVDAAAEANGGDYDSRVVGLYRSQTRAGFAPVEEDIALMREHAGDGIFLLIKPDGIARSNAVFATGDGLEQLSEVFPFRGNPSAPAPVRVEPPRMEPQREARSAMATPAAPRDIERIPRLQTARVLEGFAADKQIAPVAPARTAGVRRIFAQIACTLAILFTAAVAGYALAKWWTAPPQAEVPSTATAPGSMALHATLSGANLRIEWDRNSTPIRRASGGVLWIDDGAQHRRLDLGLDDLTQGSIQYWPTSSDVAFRLAVFTPDATLSESVRAVSVPVPQRPPVVEAAAAPPATESVAKPVVSEKPARHRESRRGLAGESKHRPSSARVFR